MKELFQQYSLSDIIIFTILLVLAIKSLVSFFDWAQDRFNKGFSKKNMKNLEKQELEQRLKQGDEIMSNLQNSQKRTDQILEDVSAKIDMLIDSDRDAIKAYITQQHHYFCYERKMIDDFSLDCLERRFEHYEDQGGNSFIEGLMDELRKLPRPTT